MRARYRGNARHRGCAPLPLTLFRSVAEILESSTNCWLGRNVAQQKCAERAELAVLESSVFRDSQSLTQSLEISVDVLPFLKRRFPYVLPEGVQFLRLGAPISLGDAARRKQRRG